MAVEQYQESEGGNAWRLALSRTPLTVNSIGQDHLLLEAEACDATADQPQLLNVATEPIVEHVRVKEVDQPIVVGLEDYIAPKQSVVQVGHSRDRGNGFEEQTRYYTDTGKTQLTNAVGGLGIDGSDFGSEGWSLH